MNIFTKIDVRSCDECPLLARREISAACSVNDRPLSDDLTHAPSWCPARGGVTVKLSELPAHYHRWTVRGASALSAKHCKDVIACQRCGLRRKRELSWFKEGVERRSMWTWVYEVNGEWVSVRPACRSSETSP